MIPTNEPIHYDCVYPQTYHCVLTHKESPCLGMYKDYANCIFISDKQIPGTIDISSPWDSAKFGELRCVELGRTKLPTTRLCCSKPLPQKIKFRNGKCSS